MMLDKTAIINAFQRAASTYDAASLLAREVGDRLLEQLDWMRIKPTRILDLGAGTGYITRLLEKRYRSADIIALDLASNMLQHYQPDPAHATYRICADAMHIPLANASCDLIVSNLMLPWCEPLPELFSEIQRVLTPSGLLLFSSFGPDVLGELRASWASVDDAAHVHLFLDLHDVGDALLRAHFSDPIVQTEWLTLTYKDAKTLFQDLKHTGATNLLHERRKTLTGKRRFQRFLAEYDTYRDTEGNLPATFEIIYGHCWKLLQQPTEAGEFRIAVEDIKKLS